MLSPMRGACLVFDFDGTILDTEEPVYRSWAELWQDHGHVIERAEWQATIGTDGVFDPWTELERRVGGPLDPALHDQRRARRDELQRAHGPRGGVIEWLDEAARLGVPVGIASSSPRSWVADHLARLDLLDRFAVLSCCDADVPPKPDPTSYRLACAGLGADPARSVAVEDSPNGVKAATRAGLFTVAMPHGLTADLDFTAADLVVDDLSGLRLPVVLARARRRAARP
jgi:HAD superfamily hydrolase (TIGR01509 family)